MAARPLSENDLKAILARWLESAIGDSVSVVSLSEKSGVSRTTIYGMKNGTGVPDLQSVANIAYVLGVPLPTFGAVPSPARALRDAAVEIIRVARLLEEGKAPTHAELHDPAAFEPLVPAKPAAPQKGRSASGGPGPSRKEG